MTALAHIHDEDLAAMPGFPLLEVVDDDLAGDLIERFTDFAIPHMPDELAIAFDADGAWLAWTDPGHDTFAAAAFYQWSLWRLDTDNQLDELIACGESITPHARPRFAVEEGRYELEVHASNKWPDRAQRLESPIATLRATTPPAPGP